MGFSSVEVAEVYEDKAVWGTEFSVIFIISDNA